MTSRKAKRIGLLAQALGERRFMHLKDAAQLVEASEMTVRRDVAASDRFVFLGGHLMLSQHPEGERPYALAVAADQQTAAKQQACRHAARHIRPDETVFIDCGTTLTHLVDLIPDDRPLTVVCYALNIANKLSAKPNITLILLGGLFHPASASFAGAECLDGFAIDVAFLSAAGIDERRGATCEHGHEAQVKRRALAAARERFLVVDQSKFGRLRRAYFAASDSFDGIITEHGETVLGGEAALRPE